MSRLETIVVVERSSIRSERSISQQNVVEIQRNYQAAMSEDWKFNS
jgi:hypothetical protein